MGKKWNLKSGDYSTAVQEIRKRGIMIYGSFLFGYDHDTVESFDRTVDFATDNKFYLANFNPLTPLPGARLYDRLQKEGRLLYDRWWLDPTYRYGEAMFKPKGMTAEQLTEGCYRARSKFNSYSSIIKRAFEPKSNAKNLRNFMVYWVTNLVSRNEIHSKQTQMLGTQTTPLWPVKTHEDHLD